jgi:hypothetical protein
VCPTTYTSVEGGTCCWPGQEKCGDGCYIPEKYQCCYGGAFACEVGETCVPTGCCRIGHKPCGDGCFDPARQRCCEDGTCDIPYKCCTYECCGSGSYCSSSGYCSRYQPDTITETEVFSETLSETSRTTYVPSFTLPPVPTFSLPPKPTWTHYESSYYFTIPSWSVDTSTYSNHVAGSPAPTSSSSTTEEQRPAKTDGPQPGGGTGAGPQVTPSVWGPVGLVILAFVVRLF